MDDADGPKVWGMFASSHMEADVDRDEFAPEQPSLAEMTRKALELLSKDEDGLFLMIEGSQVDWAGHANDPYYMMTDFLAFDEAYGVAVEFAEENGDTLVIVFPDHNTGGMTIGHYETRVPYTATTVADLLGPLVTMDTTSTGITSTGLERMIDADVRDGLALPQAIAENLDEWWGIPGLNQPLCSDEQETDDLVDEILALEPEVGLAYAIAEVISRNCTVFGWTTNGHTGEDVPLWVHDADEAYGVIENTELAEIVAEAMKANLDAEPEALCRCEGGLPGGRARYERSDQPGSRDRSSASSGQQGSGRDRRQDPPARGHRGARASGADREPAARDIDHG
jgi:alkaline phosphatase